MRKPGSIGAVSAVLTSQEHILILKCKGAPPAAAAAGMGVDFIWIQKD
jgi:hypothetical protein